MTIRTAPASTATITRSRQIPTPGKNYFFAWRWVYTVDYGRALPQLAGRPTASFDTLAAARRACVRNGFTPAVTWQ